MFYQENERGPESNKQKLIIEMNKAIHMYLNIYFRIDCIDHLTQNTKISYRNRKYWHSPMTHDKSLDVVVSYDMYL